MESNDNNWKAEVLSYVRAMNDATTVNSGEVKRVREKDFERNSYWTLVELNK